MSVRLFAESLPRDGGEIVLDREAAKHAKVLRLEPGRTVTCFDGRGLEAKAIVSALGRNQLRLGAERPVEVAATGPAVVLVQCVPKGDKIDAIVRMTTELGVSAIRLAISARSIPRPDDKQMAKRTMRLERIAREAVRQSQGVRIPDVVGAEALASVLERVPSDANRILFYEGDARRLPLEPLTRRETWVVIGPEGGFDADEARAMAESGFVLASLGKTLLRVETAAPVALSAVIDRLRAP